MSARCRHHRCHFPADFLLVGEDMCDSTFTPRTIASGPTGSPITITDPSRLRATSYPR